MREYRFWTLSINPVQLTLGTLRLVCKRNVSQVWELFNEELQEWQEIARVCESALFRTFQPDGLDDMCMIRDGQLNVLIIPRYREERFFAGKSWQDALPVWKENEVSPETLQELSQILQEKFQPVNPQMTFYFVRHGDTGWSQKGLLGGLKDFPLNDAGREQAQNYKNKLAGIPFDIGCISDTLRAEETASAILGDRPLIEDSRLSERGWGTWEGKPLRDYKKAAPDELESVESSQAIALRLTAFLNAMPAIYPGARMLVVTHGDVMRVLVAKLLGCSTLDAEIGICGDSFVKVTVTKGRFFLERMDSVLLPTVMEFDLRN